MVGLLTLVTSRVGSVTSTSLRVSRGDMRVISGPIAAVSSGALPGHSSTASGFSAPKAGQATLTQPARAIVHAHRFMVAPSLPDEGPGRHRGRPGPPATTSRRFVVAVVV